MNLLPRKYRQLLGGGLVAILGSTSTAFAQDVDINFAGFASLVYAKTISDDKKESTLYGISDEGEYRDFNKLGFRMDADMKDNLTFTAQVLATGEKDYEPEFDWIFATYTLHPEIALSVGRIRVPVFMFSDYLDTSFAYPWIQPPITIYNLHQTPFKSIEGAQLAYTTTIGDWTSELLFWGGNGQDRFTESGIDADLILEESIGMAWTVGYEWLTLRPFYYEAISTLDLTSNPQIQGLMTNITALENGLASVPGFGTVNFHDKLLWEKEKGQFYGLGLALDFETFFIYAEATRIDKVGGESNLVAPRLDSWYIAPGVRLPGHVTLTLTYGEDKDYVDKGTYQQFDPSIAKINGVVDSINTPLQQLLLIPAPTPAEQLLIATLQGQLAAIQPLQVGLNTMQSTIKSVVNLQQDFVSQHTMLTARWDFHPSASAKLEFMHDERGGDYGAGKSEGFPSGSKRKPEAVRIGLDLVF